MKMEYGFATSITSLNKLALILDAMDDHTCDTLRFAMNNTAIQSGTRPYLPDAIQQFLETTNKIAIADCNHTYPQGSINNPNSTVLNSIINRCKELATRFGSYGRRFVIEPINEYTGTNHASIMQQIVDSLREYGYTGVILYNLLPGSGPQTPLVINDPLNNIAGGFHNYMNGSSTSYSMTFAKKFSDIGVKCINTEIGASYNENSDFNTSNVTSLINYFQQSYDLGLRSDGDRKVVNTLWMNHDIDNLR